jgi:preprotein translocase subunit SecA
MPEFRALVVQVFLFRLDQFWADHLLFVEEVREGISLERYAGRDPGLEYLRRVGDAFEEGLTEVERSVQEAYERMCHDPAAATLERLGIRRPSSTWTYQVDDASPVRFNLSMIASANIGATALAAGPLLLLNAPLVLFALIARGVRRLLGRGR